MIGDNVLEIQGDNIVNDGEMYMSTPGLWTLITEINHKEYSSEDYDRYKELLYETNVLYHDYDPRGNKLKNGLKFSTLFGNVFSWKESFPMVTRSNIIAPS